jgi:hypothetical protein
MAGFYDKEEEQKITANDAPQGSTASAENVSEEAPTGIAKAEQLYKGLGDSIGKQYEADQKVIEEREKAVEEQKAKRDTAIQNGTSLVLNMLKDTKPEYDETKAKRLRNRAIVQSLGDMLSAVAMGAHAYGKKGAGYVPKMAESGHMQSLAEVDKMRDEYLKRGEEWKNLELNWKKAQADAKIAAEEKLLTKEEEKLATATSKAESTRKAYADLLNTWNKILAGYYTDIDKEKVKAANTAAQKAQDYAYDVALEGVKAKNERNGGLTDDEMAELQYIRDYVGDDSIYGTKTVETTTPKTETTEDALGNKSKKVVYVPTTKEQARTRGELKTGDLLDIISKYRNDDKAASYIYLRKGGLAHNQAMEEVTKMYSESK